MKILPSYAHVCDSKDQAVCASKERTQVSTVPTALPLPATALRQVLGAAATLELCTHAWKVVDPELELEHLCLVRG